MGGVFEPLLLVGSMLTLVAIGLPIAYAVGIATILTAFALGLPLEVILLKLSDGVDNFSMLAIPFFVFAGAIMRAPWLPRCGGVRWAPWGRA